MMRSEGICRLREVAEVTEVPGGCFKSNLRNLQQPPQLAVTSFAATLNLIGTVSSGGHDAIPILDLSAGRNGKSTRKGGRRGLLTATERNMC